MLNRIISINMIKQIYVFLALLIFSSVISATEITVAGFAFAGDYLSAASRFPYTYKLFQKAKDANKANGSLSYQIINRTKSISNSEFTLMPLDVQANLKNDQTLMTVLLLTSEVVSIENYGSYYKTFVNLRGDSLIFDYKNLTIVRSDPISVVLFDATAEKPTEERILGFVDNLIRRDDGRGLITQFTRRLASATIPKPGTKTVQVRKGEISTEALALLPNSLRTNPAVIEAMLSDSFASIISSRIGIPMLPNSVGHAVGGVMSMRLENGDDYKLKVGEGDYLFDLKLNKLVKLKTSENNVGTAYVYGVYINMRFFEPTLNIDYISSDFKNGESAVVPSSQIASDDFSGYQDAIRGLFLKFAEATAQPGNKWIETATSNKNIEAQFESVRKIMKECK